MPHLFVYLIKVNIALIIFCLGYYAVLRHLTFYSLNRVYLVCALLFSTLYPLVNLSDLISRHQEVAKPLQVVVINWQAPVLHVAGHMQYGYWYWLLLIFWVGVMLMALRLLIQLFSLFRIHGQSESAMLNDYTVRKTHRHINPFSFWQSIYINPDSHSAADLRSILEHEHIHVKQWHTLDILLGEFSIVFYWFNPGVWLLKRAIAENIEFMTDRQILQKGVDTKAYQYSLLNVGLNGGGNILVNNFNLSTIKKRIIMMNSERSSRITLARYAILLPAVLALVLVFTVSKAELTKTVSRESAKMLKAVKAAVTAVNNSVSISDKKAISNPAGLLTRDKKLSQKDTVKAAAIIPDTTKKLKTAKILPDFNSTDSVILVVDGKIVPKSQINMISPQDINDISVSKQVIGGVKSGVIVINTKKLGTKNTNPTISIYDNYSNTTTIRGLSTTRDTNYIRYVTRTVNGKSITDTLRIKNLPSKRIGHEILSYLPVTTLNSPVTRIRINGKTDTLYGLTTVMGNPFNRSGATIQNMPGRMFIIDGKEATEKQRKKLSADDIESLSLLTDKTATALYGEKAKNGVIVITTKKK